MKHTEELENNLKDDTNEVNDVPLEELSSTIQELPPQMQEKLIGMIKSERSSLHLSGNAPSDMMILLPLMNKMDSGHISQVLDNQNSKDNRKFWSPILFSIIGILCFVIIIGAFYLFRDNKLIVEYFTSFITHIGALIAGAIGGYGYKNRTR